MQTKKLVNCKEKYEHLNLVYSSRCIISRVEITDCITVDDDFTILLEIVDDYVYDIYIINDKDWNGCF